MTHVDKIKEYFKPCFPLLGENEDKVLELVNQLPEEYYECPAASGNNHSELQAKRHGLLYHVWEGFWVLDQLIRARSDIIDKYRVNWYEGTDPSSDLYTAYFLHDILKYKSNPTGTNYTHDEDCYHFLVKLGFNPVVCQIVRYTHGKWSTAVMKYRKTFIGSKYEDLIWLSHYADMAASRKNDVKLILESDGTVPNYDKSNFSNNKKRSDVSLEWWKNVGTEKVGKVETKEEIEEEEEELEDSF